MALNDDWDFDLNRRISSYRAFLVVIILSFLVAWYTVSSARKIIDNAEVSPIFNTQLRNKNISGQNNQLPAVDNPAKTNTSSNKNK
jgi:hypothetical protein